MPYASVADRKASDRARCARPEVKARNNASAKARYHAGGRLKKLEAEKRYRSRPEVATSRAEYVAQRRAGQWSKTKIAELRCRARRIGVPFDLVESDLVLPKICPIFGTPLVIGGARNDAPSVDRIIPTKGYVRGNIVVVSNRANSLKRESTLAEMRRLVEFYTPLIEGK